MDLLDRSHHDTDLMNHRPPESEAASSQILAEQAASEPAGAVARLSRSLNVRCRVAPGLAYESEAREARIRELQDAIQHKTYDITAEQIADKMLRRTLCDDLT